MKLALQREIKISDLFLRYLLARNIRYEQNLVDLHFNSSEKRLARALLLLAQSARDGMPKTVIRKISQGDLAGNGRNNQVAGQFLRE